MGDGPSAPLYPSPSPLGCQPGGIWGMGPQQGTMGRKLGTWMGGQVEAGATGRCEPRRQTLSLCFPPPSKRHPCFRAAEPFPLPPFFPSYFLSIFKTLPPPKYF